MAYQIHTCVWLHGSALLHPHCRSRGNARVEVVTRRSTVTACLVSFFDLADRWSRCLVDHNLQSLVQAFAGVHR